MIEALKDLAKGALADALLNLKAIGDVVVHVADVLSFVVVEAAVFWTIGCGQRLPAVLALQDVQVVDLVVFQNLCFFIVEQVFAEVHDDVSRLHWELDLERSLLIITQETLTSDGRVRLNTSGRVW